MEDYDEQQEDTQRGKWQETNDQEREKDGAAEDEDKARRGKEEEADDEDLCIRISILCGSAVGLGCMPYRCAASDQSRTTIAVSGRH
jgi:hypothetical protein